MAITNPVHESIGTSAEDVSIIVGREGGDFLRVKSLDGAGVVGFVVKSINGVVQDATTPVIGNDNLYYLAAAAGDEVVIPLCVRPTPTGGEATVVVAAIASAATVVQMWLDTRTG